MPRKALVIDDSAISRRVVSLVLNTNQITCIDVPNAKDALAILERDPHFDLVVVDWNMPQMSGLEFLTAVRRQSRFNHLKIFIVTANDTPESMRKAQQSGADDFITKPLTRSVVTKKLQIHGIN